MNAPHSHLDDFDPNDPGKGRWATYIPSRRASSFKMHSGLGHATGALSSIWTDGILYEQGTDGRWHEVTRRDRAKCPKTCPQCGDTPQSPFRSGPMGLSERFERTDSGKLVRPPNIIALCEPCWDVR